MGNENEHSFGIIIERGLEQQVKLSSTLWRQGSSTAAPVLSKASLWKKAAGQVAAWSRLDQLKSHANYLPNTRVRV